MNSSSIASPGLAVLIIGAVLALGGLAYFVYRRERQMRHLERLKALEYGRRLPSDPPDPDRALAHRSFSVGLWGAFWGFASAAHNSFTGSGGLAISIALAVAGAVVGVSGIVCGTVLSFRAQCRSNASPHLAAQSPGKPAFEPDAYDVVGARG